MLQIRVHLPHMHSSQLIQKSNWNNKMYKLQSTIIRQANFNGDFMWKIILRVLRLELPTFQLMSMAWALHSFKEWHLSNWSLYPYCLATLRDLKVVTKTLTGPQRRHATASQPWASRTTRSIWLVWRKSWGPWILAKDRILKFGVKWAVNWFQTQTKKCSGTSTLVLETTIRATIQWDKNMFIEIVFSQ